MNISVYGTPECSICKKLFELLSKAEKRGQITGQVQLKMLEECDGHDRETCADNLVELALIGLLDPPAVVLTNDSGDFVWGKGSIKSIRDLKLGALSKKQADGPSP